ncbi:thermonuclease family protein [Alteribacillus sp. YIM 98480]|uniref:thermonuclease family protein n=1 Tax=Alteribacillus sp. YIM 98480 TaxID=2606599 RepID=UPI001E479B50|nr:thermonuclease family protein [Alteribacillus sp. YIM 98480]
MLLISLHKIAHMYVHWRLFFGYKFSSFFIAALFILTACAEESTIDQTHETKQSVEEEIQDEQISLPEDTISATVTEVVDGDTIKVNMEGTEETIRLLLIDTPETVHPTEPEQPYGKEASAFAKEHLSVNKEVEIEIDTSIRDNYDRFLAYVWVEDEMYNKMILEEGLARVAYIIEPNTRYVDEFRDIEEEAKEKEKGIWSEDGYVTDEGFHPDAVRNSAERKQENSPEQRDCDNPQIKGNHSSNGDLIYHTPDGQYYDQTNAEEMFCTEQEAQESGYRKSQR